MTEPCWIGTETIHAVHAAQIAEHGGLYGIRSAEMLDSDLSRPLNLHAYEADSIDLCDLAAAYAFGINHPFFDGNKRTAYLAAELFLEINGHGIHLSDAAAIKATLALAAGETGEWKFAAWPRGHLGEPRNPG